MSKIKYLNLDYYDPYFKGLIERKENFILSKTTYSRKIQKEDGLTIMFNEDGGSDNDALGLINLVRDNAHKYLANTSFEQRNNQYIHFFDLFKKPKSDEVIWKVDVRSAYWDASLKRGVIEETTNSKLLKIFDGKPAGDMKRARLKALGSLATQKIIQYYIKGKLTNETIEKQLTKDLYMDICRDVDNLMRRCADENENVVYYYWDCIFIPKDYSREVIDYFKDLKYDVSTQETVLEYLPIFSDGGGYIVSKSDSKIYMVRKESIGLIEGIQ